ncbi:hypothetical protein AAFF_G00049110 [Aldrovandia affinis]|uniref:Uncharacterized protein n=1 Tax=Aldrovandia affinis TaxID=143900 RepID=A0AAD7WEH5_9TELE|nr:hypothetical protein AAFF_G00049110 [Aldrovandia affinis]
MDVLIGETARQALGARLALPPPSCSRTDADAQPPRPAPRERRVTPRTKRRRHSRLLIPAYPRAAQIEPALRLHPANSFAMQQPSNEYKSRRTAELRVGLFPPPFPRRRGASGPLRGTREPGYLLLDQ